MTTVLLGCFFLSVFLMKFISFNKSKNSSISLTDFFLFPPFSTETLKRRTPATLEKIKQTFLKAFAVGIGLVASYFLFYKLSGELQQSTLMRSYLAIIPFYLWSEMGSLATQLIYLPTGYLCPSSLENPLKSKSLSEFWGRRWNTWCEDWLRQVIYTPLRSHRFLAILIVFLFTGLTHELLINLPTFLIIQKNLFGSMIAYFIFQAAGLSLDKTLIKNHAKIQRIFLWVVVLIPSPLVINEGLLRFLRLY
jgi:hypothetical protein